MKMENDETPVVEETTALEELRLEIVDLENRSVLLEEERLEAVDLEKQAAALEEERRVIVDLEKRGAALERKWLDNVDLEHRSFALEREWLDVEKRTVRIAVSSEEPVERSFGLEVLEHSAEAIDLEFLGSGRAPLLLDHDPRQQIGIIEKTEIGSDAVLRADVRFGSGELSDTVFRDVCDGIRKNISCGYRIDKMSKIERDDGTVEMRAIRWAPMEASIVAIPADTSVGVARSAPITQPTFKKEVPMEPEINIEDVRAEAAASARADYAKATGEILALGSKHNRRDLAEAAIGKGCTVEQFRGELLDVIGNAKPLEVAEPDISPKEEREFSFLRAINASATGDWRAAGYEREVSDEIAKQSGRSPKGFYAPGSAWGQRNLIVGTNADGGFLKGTDHYGSEFIEALRGRLVVAGLGARIMSGLQGDVSIPKISAGVAAAFVGEGSAVAEANQTFAAVTLAPKTLGAFTDISRKLMAQSDPSANAIVRDDLLNAIAAKLEDVTIEGGGSNEPTGITGTSGIGSVAIGTNGGAPTWASAVNLVKECEIDNALMTDNLAFLTNPKVKAKLSSTAKGSGDSVMIMESPWDSLYGYKMGITTHVPSDLTKGSTSGTCSAMIFGDFSQLLMAFWSSPDILVDPYTGGSAGNTRVIVMQDVDVAVRHAQSFAACLDYTT
jgi:HK97 family phage major capsid protein